jgi:hypothetical protein
MTAMRSMCLGVVALVFSYSLASCGGTGGGGGIPLQQLGDEWSRAQCASSVRCGQYPDMASCLSSLPYSFASVEPYVESGKVLYDGAAAAQCVDIISALSCNQSETLDSSPRSCQHIFKGTIADGSHCYDDRECQSGICKHEQCPVACCVGTCALSEPPPISGPRLGAGEPCDDSAPTIPFQCASGLWCLASAGSRCGRLPRRGEACDPESQPCDSFTDTCGPVSRTCVPLVDVGGTCSDAAPCVAYAWCHPDTMTCVARVGVGEACTVVADCLIPLVCRNGACDYLDPPQPSQGCP